MYILSYTFPKASENRHFYFVFKLSLCRKKAIWIMIQKYIPWLNLQLLFVKKIYNFADPTNQWTINQPKITPVQFNISEPIWPLKNLNPNENLIKIQYKKEEGKERHKIKWKFPWTLWIEHFPCLERKMFQKNNVNKLSIIWKNK